MSEKDFHVRDLVYSMIYAAKAFFKDKDLKAAITYREAEIIVGFINYMASLKCIDLALRVSDLKEERKDRFYDYRRLTDEDKEIVFNLPSLCLKLFPPLASEYIRWHKHNELVRKEDLSEENVKATMETFLIFFQAEKW